MFIVGGIEGGIIKIIFFFVIECDDIVIILQMFVGIQDEIIMQWFEYVEVVVWVVNEKLSQEYYNNEK